MLGFGSTPFVVGDLSSPPGSRPIHALQAVCDLNDVKDGQHLTRWGWLFEWGSGCIRPQELELLRHEGDPLCDEVVRLLELKPGEDGLRRLRDYMSSNDEDKWDDCISKFWKEIARDPPQELSALQPSKAYLQSQRGVRADKRSFANGHLDLKLPDDFEEAQMNGSSHDSEEEPKNKVYTPEAAIQQQNSRPLPILSEGQAVFWRNSSDMFFTLLHFSLAGGFSANRIMSTLKETAYLTSASRDATYRRLMETTQALVDFMGDMTPITGKGWQSAIRVRMLHSQVRVRILDGKSRLNQYSVEKDGLPVNQEDLIATLGGFCIAPLWCQRRLGNHLTLQEELAFIAAWRHIGYYLGIAPSSLLRWFNTDDHTTTSHSHRFFACVAYHLFDSPIPPKDPFSTATYRILHAVAHRPPGARSTLYHCELSRKLLGPGLANQLAIPRGSWKEYLGVQQHCINSWLTHNFSRFYFKRWSVQRQLLFRRIITLIIAWQLGEKRSHFTWKEPEDHEKKVSELASKDAGEDAGLEFGIKVGRSLRSEARWIFGEMGVVLAACGLFAVILTWQAVKLVIPVYAAAADVL